MGLTVVVADDHPLFLDGIAQLVAAAEDMELVGRAASGEELVDLVATSDPEVVVTDLGMPGLSGVEAIRRMRAADPTRRVLVLTMHDGNAMVDAALRAGAKGYALKESAPELVLDAIRAVGHDMTVLGPGVDPSAAGPAPLSPFPELTPREQEIVALVAAGRTNLAVARELGLSEKTVRNYLSGILVKVRVVDRTALIDLARLNGL